MTPRQVALIKSSFASIAHLEGEVAAIFYGKLFDMDPSLRGLFKGDMVEQGQKLMRVLGVVVANAGRIDTVIPTVRGLGKRHVEYGAREEHYATVGQALLATLEAGLGEAFTAEVRDAWTEVYQTLATVMIDAGKVHLHSQEMEKQMKEGTAQRPFSFATNVAQQPQAGSGRTATYGVFAAIIAVVLAALAVLRQIT